MSGIEKLRQLHGELGRLLDDNESDTWRKELWELHEKFNALAEEECERHWRKKNVRKKLEEFQQKVSVLLDDNELETPAWNEKLLEVLLYMNRFTEAELELRLRYL